MKSSLSTVAKVKKKVNKGEESNNFSKMDFI